MFRILRKLAGRDSAAQARAALDDARKSLEDAHAHTREIQRVTSRVEYHGRRNHFGERWEALARRISTEEGTL